MDSSGYINIKELIMYLDSVADDGVDESEVREIFNKLDVTGDRNIDYWEFEVVPLCIVPTQALAGENWVSARVDCHLPITYVRR